MADVLEGTPEFNRHHAHVTGEIPITVSDDERHDMFAQAMSLAHDRCPDCDGEGTRLETRPLANSNYRTCDTCGGSGVEPIVPQCDLENPESCDSCQ